MQFLETFTAKPSRHSSKKMSLYVDTERGRGSERERVSERERERESERESECVRVLYICIHKRVF